MSDTPPRRNIVCLASYFKGEEFLRECRRQNCRVFLVTKEKWRGEEWPHDSIDEFITLPDDATPEHFIYSVTQIARRHKLSRVVALEEFDVITAGLIREHLRLPGMTSAEARLFRDKLAMRGVAEAARINVPEFVHVLHYGELQEFMRRVPAPWVLKPRTDVSAIGIRKVSDAEQVWRAIDALDARERLSEQSSFYLLERFVAGEVYHVDSIVSGGRVAFAGVSMYGRPPMNVAHEGGVFISHTLERRGGERRKLLEINRQVINALGLRRGATHAEFIRSAADGKYYFLEIAARVGGAYIAEALEAASGLNIWREWAKLELSDDAHPYRAEPAREEYGGIVLSLARQERPDTSRYTDAEIVYRVRKPYHAGLVVRSPDHARLRELLDDYARRFADDFIAVAPPLERAE
ncbi:MAG TPA: ATP-grasp domain-containing protein [Pyrinomonadaceae bacterium]|nr:ATP-grasp domain-containing protein [Pyrinomonadaceae bacterium]